MEKGGVGKTHQMCCTLFRAEAHLHSSAAPCDACRRGTSTVRSFGTEAAMADSEDVQRAYDTYADSYDQVWPCEGQPADVSAEAAARRRCAITDGGALLCLHARGCLAAGRRRGSRGVWHARHAPADSCPGKGRCTGGTQGPSLPSLPPPPHTAQIYDGAPVCPASSAQRLLNVGPSRAVVADRLASAQA